MAASFAASESQSSTAPRTDYTFHLVLRLLSIGPASLPMSACSSIRDICLTHGTHETHESHDFIIPFHKVQSSNIISNINVTVFVRFVRFMRYWRIYKWAVEHNSPYIAFLTSMLMLLIAIAILLQVQLPFATRHVTSLLIVHHVVCHFA